MRTNVKNLKDEDLLAVVPEEIA